ncbi:hypothetical protein, partial [Agromyces tardus]|uniref:hypothetical protein n=1 Tax=Agromyces tardus TaxID=2583849 RepID=UPI001BB06130
DGRRDGGGARRCARDAAGRDDVSCAGTAGDDVSGARAGLAGDRPGQGVGVGVALVADWRNAW